MNKYTPELIEEYAKAAEGFNEPTIGRMLRDYATLLRERESAKATVTDEIVHAALTEYYGGEPHPNCTPSMRAALEAVAPMLASESTEELKEWEQFGREIESRLRYNPWGFKGSYPEIIDQIIKLASARANVKEMVNRFLSWRLPNDFRPDGGISFTHITYPEWTHDSWPTGTNLFHAGQAEQMIHHMLGAAPNPETEEREMKNDIPAFPGGVNSVYTNLTEGEPTHTGMTLRDYFAAKALCGWLASYSDEASHPADGTAEPTWAENIAVASYRMADAMLRAREAQP